MRVPSLSVAGLPVVAAGLADASDLLWGDMRSRTGRVYAFVNAHSSILVRRSPDYQTVLERDTTVPLVDGSSLAFGARVFGGIDLRRSPGPDFFLQSMARAEQDGTKFFFIGGAPGVVERLVDKAHESYPDLKVTGVVTPSFGEWTEDELAGFIESIKTADPDVIWVGVSAPKQEIWADGVVGRLSRPVVCVGAAFDYLSGTKPRAPRWVRRLGMEWLHRLLTEPGRLWKRYLVGNTVFMFDLVTKGVRKHEVHVETER